MTEHDDLPTEDARDNADFADDALPGDVLAALGAAWRAQPVPPLEREFAQEDEATRRAVQWMAAAFRAPGVLEPSAAATQRARFAARRRAAPRAAAVGAWRQVAAAAMLIALLSAALWFEDLPWFASRDAERPAPAPRTVAEIISSDTGDADTMGTAGATAPAVPFANIANIAPNAPDAPFATIAPTVPFAPTVAAAPASTLPPPLEMRSGNVRLILFTDASQSVPERLP